MKNWLYLFLFILLFSCTKSENEIEIITSYSSTNFINHEGIDREYVLHIPDSYSENTPLPLVINFHGFGQTIENYMEKVDMRPLANTESFILVYPQGSLLGNAPHWNSCPPIENNKSLVDDFGFIEKMINQIASEYNVDQERIYAIGYSNGGMMAYGLAHHKSELIAGIGSVSGVMLGCFGTTSHPIPVIHLHGTLDFVLPYTGGNFFLSVQAVLDYWIEFNNTEVNPTVSIDSESDIPIEHYVYGSGDNGVSVEHYKYILGNHGWFSAKYKGKSTAELLWDFLSQYDIEGLR